MKDLANAAYDAALRDDLEGAADQVRLIALRGPGAMNEAMLRWVDRTIDILALPRGAILGFVLEDDGTAENLDPDAVSPEVRWAGRMFSARLAGDPETWKALILALPRDPTIVTRHVMTLLDTLTTTAAAAEEDEDTPRPNCCVLHAIDPTVAAARRAVANLN